MGKSGKDLLVTIGERDAWRLLEYCLANYLNIADQLGIEIDGKSVREVQVILSWIQKADVSTEEIKRAVDLIKQKYEENRKAFKESREKTNEEKALYYVRQYGVTF